jgi:hypothetical protein
MRVTILAATIIPLAAIGADFAPSGTAGTLTVKVVAEGGARHQARPGAGLAAREWKVKNSGQFVIRLRALSPAGDASGENQDNAAAARAAMDQAITDKDQEVLDQWQEKSDACDGDEACENRVMGQMIADPEYLRIMSKMQGAAPAVLEAAQAVDVAPGMQVWSTDPMDPSPATGSLQLDMQEIGYGVVDTGGGGTVDVTCRWSGDVKIAPGSPESKVGASLRVDAKASRYEIRIPAEAFGARLTESCADSKSGSHGKSKNTRNVRLIGAAPPPGVKDFGQLLTFKGPLGSASSPQMSGKQVITTELLQGNSGDPVPVKVSIEWQFSAGGR